ncbi:MAG: hemerythrin domain-containing protein [Acidimicrobiia bacterium]|nr:MAG: hemerythrin domain-containing protein [Acidimicrobiia bacterium]
MTDDNTATTTLREEHQLILEVTAALTDMLGREQDGVPLDYEAVERCITFFRLFADACHHGKEEDLLFPGLEAEGMPRDTGPIAVMLHEHELGRGLVRTMAASLDGAREGDESAGDDLRGAALGFIDLIVAHIGKEDNVLFAMADGLIVGAACRDLCARYDEVCARRFEGRTLEDLEHLAAEILAG